MAGNKFVIPIAYKSDKSGLNKAENDLDGFGKSVAKIGGIIAAAFSAAVIVDFAKQAVTAASDLQQAVGATEAVFTQGLEKVNEFAEKSAQNVGISEAAYKQLAATMGAMLKNTGTPMDQLADKTDALIKLAADLSATFGGDLTQATTAVAAALRGETDPIERYGISIKAVNVEAKALTMTGKSLVSQLTEEEKAAARVALLFEQSADSAGMFAKESDSLANIQQRLNAEWENAQATIGAALLPAVSKLSEALLPLVEDITPILADLFEGLSPIIDVLVDAADPLIVAILDLVNAFVPLVPLMAEIIQNLLPPMINLLGSLISLFVENPDFMAGTTSNMEDFAAAAREMGKGIDGIAKFIGDVTRAYNSLPAPIKWLFNEGSKALNPFTGLFNAVNTFGSQPSSQFINRPKLAEGGIVMPRPGGVPVTVAEAGEAEAVIPLSKMGSLGSTVNIYGNVGYDAVELAREIARRQRQTYSLTGVSRLVGVS